MPGAVVTFAEHSATLTDQAMETLKQFVPTIAGKRHKIELRGHATHVPLPAGSPYQDAWQLCYARCLATMKFLVEQGISADRIRLTQASVFEPHSIRVDPEHQSQNPRVEVYILSELVEDLMGSREERAERFKNP